MTDSASPRARFREQTRGEIKEIALRQLAEGGIGAIALTRIAKELGLSGPALYRYFAGRDDLVSALIRDAYDDAAAAIAAGVTRGTPRKRLRALARAFRAWGVAEPHRYLLIAGTPLPGYTAPPDTLLRARAALTPFLAVFAEAEPRPAIGTVARQLEKWAEREPSLMEWVGGQADAARAGTVLAGAIMAWSRLHGVVGLGVIGQFDGMGHDPAALLDAEMELLADEFSLA